MRSVAKVKIGTTVSPQIAEALEKYCEKEGRNKNYVIEHALREWFINRDHVVDKPIQSTLKFK